MKFLFFNLDNNKYYILKEKDIKGMKGITSKGYNYQTRGNPGAALQKGLNQLIH